MNYNNWITINYCGNLYERYINFSKLGKTISVEKDGLSARIKVEKLQISPRTYWKLGRYCQMFEGHDYGCLLCECHGTAYSDSVCKCKESFTIEEHLENCKILNQKQ